MLHDMENALLDLPDFARGEGPSPEKLSQFQPLFDGPKKVEMVSDIVIEAPIVEQSAENTISRPYENSSSTPPDNVPENETEQISLEEHEAIIHDLKKNYEVELNMLQDTHQNEVLHELCALKSNLFDDVSKQLEHKVAQTLAPLVEACISRNTLDALVKEISLIVGKDALKSLHLSGPASLISAVKKRVTDSPLIIEVEETDGTELVARLNDKLISTRLKEWSHKIETAIL